MVRKRPGFQMHSWVFDHQLRGVERILQSGTKRTGQHQHLQFLALPSLRGHERDVIARTSVVAPLPIRILAT